MVLLELRCGRGAFGLKNAPLWVSLSGPSRSGWLPYCLEQEQRLSYELCVGNRGRERSRIPTPSLGMWPPNTGARAAHTLISILFVDFRAAFTRTFRYLSKMHTDTHRQYYTAVLSWLACYNLNFLTIRFGNLIHQSWIQLNSTIR